LDRLLSEGSAPRITDKIGGAGHEKESQETKKARHFVTCHPPSGDRHSGKGSPVGR